jgi:hypothetical protein
VCRKKKDSKKKYIRAVTLERLSSSALDNSAAQFVKPSFQNSQGDGVLFVYVDFVVSVEDYNV